jgi:flagellin
MGLRINTNIASINAQRNLHQSNREVQKSISRLSSGERIVNAADDAAGLAIGTNLKAQIRGTRQATRNANDGIAVIQTAEGGMNEVSQILIRLRELSVQAASDTLGDTERGFLDREVQQLKSEVNRIAESTNFNGTPLLNGEASEGTMQFHVGAASGDENIISYEVSDSNVRAGEIGIDGVAVNSREGALDTMDSVDAALDNVNSMRANLGALQNRLQSTVRSLRISTENLSDAKSRVMDTDVAAETANYTKNNILQNAGISTLSQANAAPQNALKLI